MTFKEFNERFGTEIDCINHFIKVKYKGTIGCHHCGSIKVYHSTTKPKKFQCADCNNSFSIFKGTIFENSSTDLRKWFYAIHLFLNGKKGISGLQLMRETTVTYKTAWRMLKQIRTAMGQQDFTNEFTTIVEIDETYIEGKPRKDKNKKNDNNKRGRGTKKTPVVGIVDRDNKKVYA